MVPRDRGGRALPDRRYLVADRDRRPHDHAASRRDTDQARLGDLPLPGIFADIVDETGQPVGRGKGGILVITKPWPSMLRTIWGDAERYKKTYWPDDFKGKLYLAGDGAARTRMGTSASSVASTTC